MKKKYWIYITAYYCPLCGKTEEYRSRQYTPRPEKYRDRHKEIEYYDYCDS